MAEDFYKEGDYLSHNPTWHVADSPWKAGQIMKMIRRHNLQPHRVCEVGCGAGEVLRQVHQKLGPEAVSEGYEISPQAFQLCRKIADQRLQFFEEDFTVTPTPVFDLILLIDVVEHIEDCFGFLRRLRHRGTHFILHFPLDMCAQNIIRGTPILRLRSTVGHVHYFMKDTVLALLREAGYEVVDSFYTATDLELETQSLKASLAKWPRKFLFAMNNDLAVRLVGGWSLMVLVRGTPAAAAPAPGVPAR